MVAVNPLDESDASKRQELNELFALNRKLFKAYMLKESLDRLWNYTYEGAMAVICNAGSISSVGNDSTL